MTVDINNKPSNETCECCKKKYTELLSEFKNSKILELSEIERLNDLNYDTLGLILDFKANIYPIHVTVSHQRKSRFRPPHLVEDPTRWDGFVNEAWEVFIGLGINRLF